MKPLEGLIVLDFSQFLAGPSAAMRLADLGARVIKVERPKSGDLCRQLYNSNLELDGDSTLFHSINRNKQSITLNLKDSDDLNKAKTLIQKADVLIQNFRPGVMERIGLDYNTVKEINPRLVYGIVTGYGSDGPWKNKPGQDLLVQSITGLPWLNGNGDQPPQPFGLSVVDMYTGSHLVQGILACLVRRGITNEGGLVEVSLLESALDLQFEVLTTFLNDGGQLPERSKVSNGNAYLAAPYGIYPTADGFIAIAMISIPYLGELIDCQALTSYSDDDGFAKRDEIKSVLGDHLKTQSTDYWLNILEPKDVWCADVMTWDRLVEHDGFKALNMVQNVKRNGTISLSTLRCPIRVDRVILTAEKGAPRLGEDTVQLVEEFALDTL